LERHLPKFNKFITVRLLAKFPRDFAWVRRHNRKRLGIFVYFMVESPFESTRTFPELNRIGVVSNEEIPQIVKNCSGMNLEWMRSSIEDFLGHMNGVRNDNNFGDIIQSTCLVNATPYSE